MKPENYKYHLAIRLKGWDYSNPGIYFVTICANEREEVFGTIENEQSIMNDLGLIADACWKQIPSHFPNASLMDYIIMPDHLHGLICLANDKNGTIYRASMGENTESFGKPTKGSVPTIIRTYKAAVTRAVNRECPESSTLVWQPGYYEHIIRNQEELEYTINYIKSNPEKWELDHDIL